MIEAFKRARQEIDATLVLLGNVATDDPEGKEVYESLLDEQEERILILSKEDTALVNALQRRAAVVLQKSLREGFGLTVTEAMCKGAAVVGGDVGGLRRQITDGHNGFLVSSVKEPAERIVQLVKNPDLRNRLGEQARGTVKENFLLTRLLENSLDLFEGSGPNTGLRSEYRRRAVLGVIHRDQPAPGSDRSGLKPLGRSRPVKASLADHEGDLAVDAIRLNFSILDDGPVVVDVDVFDVVDGFRRLPKNFLGGLFERIALSEDFDCLGYRHKQVRM